MGGLVLGLRVQNFRFGGVPDMRVWAFLRVWAFVLRVLNGHGGKSMTAEHPKCLLEALVSVRGLGVLGFSV